jgi:uncharacterized membrane protein SpoIIM required for sporulation/ABC-type transport system involved in multi-copper enzyme maturation permease subunit
MWDSLSPVWLVARRELRDQFRDWRVLAPLVILTVCFPILMNEFARAAVDFINQFNANLVLDRLVPFSVLIIGFFPITISLVVALESFVGEKERGTIEPLLSTPLDNWQMYFGKLLVGILTPLAASYISISFYMLMVSHQKLNMPPWHVILQLILLTTAHAILMVSAAIVISVQSTSVKAANLMASFIVIPVAILMQGESVLLFWGNQEVLWLAVAAVMILAWLLIRVGIAHFQREYLLGREIDVINFRWIWRRFWSYFSAGAHSLLDWYAKAVIPALGRLLRPMVLMLVIAAIGIAMGYDWSLHNIPAMLEKAGPEEVARLTAHARQSPELTDFADRISAPALFMHNSRVVLGILMAGLFSFSVLGILVYLMNIALLGGVFGLFQLLGLSPWPLFLAGVVPHGVFEIPALMLASAAVLRIGVVLVTPQTGKSIGEVILELLAGWTIVFIGVVIPLLAIAATIEAYVTPGILLATIK